MSDVLEQLRWLVANGNVVVYGGAGSIFNDAATVIADLRATLAAIEAHLTVAGIPAEGHSLVERVEMLVGRALTQAPVDVHVHNTRAVIDALETAPGARRQSLVERVETGRVTEGQP